MVNRKSEIYIKNGLALGGYDVVQIFESREVKPGLPSFQYKYEGAVWTFSSEDNLRLFRANPSKYKPAYGGYCAYGISQGYKAPTRIHLFEVVDNVLYFNFSPYIKRFWIRHQTFLIDMADDKWLNIQHDPMIRVNYYWIYLKYLVFKSLGIPFFGKVESPQITG
ncbi:MAG: YHS domain-containing (seleno)protein [Cytophagales bacterium]|nr:YHS domain-containing (seleno)protein [Cytophagales bacterium]